MTEFRRHAAAMWVFQLLRKLCSALLVPLVLRLQGGGVSAPMNVQAGRGVVRGGHVSETRSSHVRLGIRENARMLFERIVKPRLETWVIDEIPADAGVQEALHENVESRFWSSVG